MKTLFKSVLTFCQELSIPIAWNSAKRLSSFFGLIGVIAWFGSLHFYLIVPSILFIGIAWVLLYKIEYGWRSRRTFGREA